MDASKFTLSTDLIVHNYDWNLSVLKHPQQLDAFMSFLPYMYCMSTVEYRGFLDVPFQDNFNPPQTHKAKSLNSQLVLVRPCPPIDTRCFRRSSRNSQYFVHRYGVDGLVLERHCFGRSSPRQCGPLYPKVKPIDRLVLTWNTVLA